MGTTRNPCVDRQLQGFPDGVSINPGIITCLETIKWQMLETPRGRHCQFQACVPEYDFAGDVRQPSDAETSPGSHLCIKAGFISPLGKGNTKDRVEDISWGKTMASSNVQLTVLHQ